MDINSVTKQDMRLIEKLIPYTSPEKIPLSFVYGNRKICGIPAEFSPRVIRRPINASVTQTVIEGVNADGLRVRAEYLEYRDFAATEWVAYLSNDGGFNTPVISDFRIFDSAYIEAPSPRFQHGNGDNCQPTGYTQTTDALTEAVELCPSGGTPCCGASPYMRVIADGWCVSIAVGWPGGWKATVAPADGGAAVTVGQARSHMYIAPGETMRTPRVNLLGSIGDNTRAINIWRHWYMAHIIPRENGHMIPPLLCLHVFSDNGPEFTGTTAASQLDGLEKYAAHGLTPDLWWIDAGWYKCDFNWPHTGSWRHDPERFPDGLGVIGEKCEELGARLMMWFEPERVAPGTELAAHTDWLLPRKGESPETNDCLLNLGNREACDWIIDRVDSLIKEYRIAVYRQDFNYDPLPNWVACETENRVGALENLHVQGYLRYWDALIERNPGLWIDSCASGGRRNELETMRRAVPLHYTDVGYGNHPIKQKQHRMMFEWIPYFRAHNMSWDDGDGNYDRGGAVQDEFAYQCALAPAMTDMIDRNASDADFALALKMTGVWRRAARLMLRCDYYPLSDCRADPSDYYAMQFHGHRHGGGFFQVVRNGRCFEDEYLLRLCCLDADKKYRLKDAVSGKVTEVTGEELLSGYAIHIPRRSGTVVFYSEIRSRRR